MPVENILSKRAVITQEDPAAKRSRVTEPVELAFRTGLLEESVRSEIAAAYTASQPYKHCVIRDFINDDLLRAVRKEITTELHFTVKETDIYKVLQTGDLANLDGLPIQELDRLSNLLRLRNALYSPEFRSFISDVTGCGHLSGKKTDMSINTYSEGCHLLCHDDVIGSRRVSYILYLTDPDKPWQPSWGGALQLYPCILKGTPAIDPCVVIPPQWNQLSMFAVQPGASFHDVEEVIVEERPRLSISGWFHAPQEGEPGYGEETEEERAPASLEQLETSADDSSFSFQPYSEDNNSTLADFTETELSELSRWINPRYLQPEILKQVFSRFAEESSIQLTDFLSADVISDLNAAIRAADERDGFSTAGTRHKHSVGIGKGWIGRGPPHKQRFVELLEEEDERKGEAEEISDKGVQLWCDLRSMLFRSPLFRRFLTYATGLCPTAHRGKIRRFRPGFDYTLASPGPGHFVMDATLCIVEKPEIWAEDEIGGYDCYMEADEGNDDAAIYRSSSNQNSEGEDDGLLLTSSAGNNVLTLVLRDIGVMRFVKYVSARSPGSRWDVAFEYKVDVSEEEDSDIDKETMEE